MTPSDFVALEFSFVLLIERGGNMRSIDSSSVGDLISRIDCDFPKIDQIIYLGDTFSYVANNFTILVNSKELRGIIVTNECPGDAVVDWVEFFCIGGLAS